MDEDKQVHCLGDLQEVVASVVILGISGNLVRKGNISQGIFFKILINCVGDKAHLRVVEAGLDVGWAAGYSHHGLRVEVPVVHLQVKLW